MHEQTQKGVIVYSATYHTTIQNGEARRKQEIRSACQLLERSTALTTVTPTRTHRNSRCWCRPGAGQGISNARPI